MLHILIRLEIIENHFTILEYAQDFLHIVYTLEVSCRYIFKFYFQLSIISNTRTDKTDLIIIFSFLQTCYLTSFTH